MGGYRNRDRLTGLIASGHSEFYWKGKHSVCGPRIRTQQASVLVKFSPLNVDLPHTGCFP